MNLIANHVLKVTQGDLCQKGYGRSNELEAHENSYDHQHKKVSPWAHVIPIPFVLQASGPVLEFLLHLIRTTLPPQCPCGGKRFHHCHHLNAIRRT